MGTFGSVRYQTMCAHVSSLCEYNTKQQRPASHCNKTFMDSISDLFNVLLISLPQVWERPGGRRPHQHSGSQDPQGNFTSNCFKAVLSLWSKRKQWLGICAGVFVAEFITFLLVWQVNIQQWAAWYYIFQLLYKKKSTQRQENTTFTNSRQMKLLHLITTINKW